MYFSSTYHFYAWITIIEYSKHELGTLNMLYSPRKNLSDYTATSLATSPQQPLSSVPKVAIST